MRSKALKITITGPAASGKSAVAQAVEELLRSYGAGVENCDEDRPRHPDRLRALLVAIGPAVTVEIKTVRGEG